MTKIEYRNLFGLIIAAISVVTSGMQQILCRTVQQKNKMASHELLARTAPAQGFSLIIIGPLLDRVLFGAWVTRYEYSVPAYAWLFASCAIAVLVNLSQFMCLGRFSAVSFQVLGTLGCVCRAPTCPSWYYCGHHHTIGAGSCQDVFGAAGRVDDLP